MQRRSVPIESLLLRTFLAAVIVLAILLAILIYDRIYASIRNGFESKLVTASALTGALIDPRDHDQLIASATAGRDPQVVESLPMYQRNNEPIRRIQTSLGLTYLYSQVLGGPADILYVLDGSQGDEHSPIGSSDDLSDETRAGLEQVENAGAIYVSPIEYQEQWGLLLTAAAPILGRDGKITSSAGADVNISVIQVATQNALFVSALIGLASILASLYVSLQLVRRIAKPIEGLTQDALRVAAGGTARPAATTEPSEVSDLRRELDALAERMALDNDRRKQTIARHEAQVTANVLATASTSNADTPVTLVSQRDLHVTWFAAEDAGAVAVLANRAMIRVARRIAEDRSLSRQWRQLADLRYGGCIVIDRVRETLECVGMAAPTIRVDGVSIRPEAGSPMRFDIGRVVSLSRAGRVEHVIWMGSAG